MWLWCLRAPCAPAVLPARSSRSTGASGCERRLGVVDQRRQLLVVDLDQLDRIGRDVAVVGDHEDDLLVLEQHLAVGEHRLDVARERRHVVQVQGLQVVGRAAPRARPRAPWPSLTSIDLMRAWPYWLRTKSPNSMPGSFRSST